MFRLSNCTLLLIAASCYLVYSSQAKALQDANKLDLANRISGISAVSARTAAAAEARHKRAMGAEYKELNDIIDELEENSLVQKANAAVSPTQSQEFDLDNMPPLTYYLLLQKLRQLQSSGEPAYRVRTPRLGRSIDFQQFLGSGRGGSEEATGGQFVSRMMKKSVPFKPRLGKRAQVCGGGD
ncbi:protein hugin [Drosophila grimshawi]|uniref:GH18699 n=1 Tax=Drosophila grimshawi TaxID=7222 RepID=B4JGS6_DROGR|nr:protein hugin [Drosophila grimshawi]EDV92680.1 GH18699 [Drosophila grimshawi]